ncbi:hypothetical protein [Caminibacter sp.]
MSKLILFLIIIGGIYYFYKKSSQKEVRNKNENDMDLIMCDKCKTFYPKNEIKNINGKNICKECYENT